MNESLNKQRCLNGMPRSLKRIDNDEACERYNNNNEKICIAQT